MANTKNTKNKSGKTNSSGKSTRKKKNSSDDTIKFLLVLVIAAIAIALIFFSRSKDDEPGSKITGTPMPTMTAEQDNPGNDSQVPEATTAPTTSPVTGQETPDNTQTPEPTATPTPALSAAEAEKIVAQKVDVSVYDVQLISENLIVLLPK